MLSSPWSWPVPGRGGVGRGGSGRQGRGGAGREGLGCRGGGMEEGPYLVAGEGFLLEQGSGELGKGSFVAGEQFPGTGFCPGEQGGDFLVDQPLCVLGVAAQRGVAGVLAGVADRADRVAEAELADHLGCQG